MKTSKRPSTVTHPASISPRATLIAVITLATILPITVYAQAFNSGYGSGVPLFTEQQLLNQALIAYGGSDTLQMRIGSFTNYIILPVLPRIMSLTVASTNVTLRLSTVSNQTYAVERRDDFGAGFWTTVSGNIPGTGEIVTFTNQIPADLPQLFYRTRQSP